MQTIYLDISNKGVIPTIYAKQGDVGRKFLVVLTDSGIPYAPPAGSVFSAWYEGDSGEGNYTDIGEKSAFSANGNKVTVEMISQMLSNDGDGVLSLVLNDPNGNQISTWNIPYICEYVPGADGEEAKAYYTAFSQAVENLPYPDASLSVPGKAADAAATGKALEGKAPAGYGLGANLFKQGPHLTSLEQLNTATKTGWYSLFASPSTINNITFDCAVIEVISYIDGRTTQKLYPITNNLSNNTMLIRHSWNDALGEWDCENPPMALGVEYRTTERWNGKPVWVMAFGIGNLPNNSTMSVEVPWQIGNQATGVISALVIADNGSYLNIVDSANPWGIWVMTKGDYSAFTATMIVKYIKS